MAGRSVKSGVPQGFLLAPVQFNIYISNSDSEIKCSLSKFADDMKLSSAVHSLEGRDAIQRDLDMLEKCACVDLIKFNKANARSCTWVKANPGINAGWRMKGMRAAQ